MHRRRFLAAVGVAGLAGCLGNEQPTAANGGSSTPSSGTASASDTPASDLPLARRGDPPDICETPLDAGVTIRAIVEPRFAADWSGIDPRGYRPLGADSTVVSVERRGTARAYPLTVLWQHEVVNDALDGPVAVTYCSLCRSGMVASRVVDGEPTRFGVTGLLWTPPSAEAAESTEDDRVFPADLADGADDPKVETTDNLVMYDAATGSYWSQLLTRAICGPHRGERLSVLPATVTTWGEWHAEHPEGEVLLPPPHSVARNPPAASR